MTSNLNRALEWTSPQSQPLLLGALSFLALVLFSVAVWPKLKLLRSARSAERCDRVFERIALTLKVAFGQSKLMQEKGAGWMHALIFWGFLILLFRAAEFFIIGFFPETDFSFPASNVVFVAYAWIKDAAVLLVGLAVCFALYRRSVLIPQRLILFGDGLLFCPLYTSDAADDLRCGDLGGLRKSKKQNNMCYTHSSTEPVRVHKR